MVEDLKFPLKYKDGWRWNSGGFSSYNFYNLYDNPDRSDIISVTIDTPVEIPIETLYALIESSDHIRLEEKLNDMALGSFDKGEANAIITYIEKLRKLVTAKWKEKYDGQLPHLEE